ncbi:hypothetical protein J2790_000799 [Paenarthrobacter nicotinovorans]|uniref:Uncharacterized protein n=1 Tax=Paenarthrobacter nicotinovorans TaxID=29320 RepID=A0ABV0GV06_PAENI|nr:MULTISPECIES: hypothetical protein [Micrococcaceae]MDR6435678.1 hypothetical protein [Paenarthrobacter nicotinovorans]
MATLNNVAGFLVAGLDAEEVDLMIAMILRAPLPVAARRHQPIIPVPASASQS